MRPGRKKGTKKTGGRNTGTPNRTTKESHELFNMIMNRQMDRIDFALTRISDDEKYLNSISKLLQYYLPRKTDITSDDKPISVMPTIVIKNGD
jgi:hypothetical protein